MGAGVRRILVNIEIRPMFDDEHVEFSDRHYLTVSDADLGHCWSAPSTIEELRDEALKQLDEFFDVRLLHADG